MTVTKHNPPLSCKFQTTTRRVHTADAVTAIRIRRPVFRLCLSTTVPVAAYLR